jgi:hypothetical protein
MPFPSHISEYKYLETNNDGPSIGGQIMLKTVPKSHLDELLR